MKEYITNESTIIFSPNYNKQIDINLLLTYNKIIFSNYMLTDDLFERYSNNDFYDLKYIGSIYNQYLKLHKNLINLIFDYYFNLPVKLSNITHLTFGKDFNQPVELPLNITHLTFGEDFNKFIKLSSNLILITFGNCFNQPVELSPNIIYLTFGWDFNQSIV